MSLFLVAFAALNLAAAASLPAAADPTAPTQLHIAFAGASDVRVAWKTAAAAPSACAWGPTSASMTSNATGASVEYLPGHGFHHAVKLSPLSASTTYFYSCGGSAPRAIVTAPPAGAPASFSAMIFGDWGYLDSTLRPPSIPVDGMQTNWSASLTRELLETLGPNGPGGAAASYNFSWIVGDIAYADDSRFTRASSSTSPTSPCTTGSFSGTRTSARPFLSWSRSATMASNARNAHARTHATGPLTVHCATPPT